MATDVSCAMNDRANSPPQGLSRDLIIKNDRGLHARASARFVQCAESFDAEIYVLREGQRILATSIMGLMMLGAGRGSSIRIEATGLDAAQAMDALAALVDSGFGDADLDVNDGNFPNRAP